MRGWSLTERHSKTDRGAKASSWSMRLGEGPQNWSEVADALTMAPTGNSWGYGRYLPIEGSAFSS